MSRKKSKQIKKIVKKLDKTTIIILCLFLILGLAVGVGTSYFVMRNDVFAINGETEIVLNVGDEYVEGGAKAIAFGKDISSFVQIDGQVDTENEGEYILKYTVDNFRFRNYVLYKLVKVVGEENNG